MKRLIAVCAVAVVVVIATGVQAGDFTLTGTDHKDVTTYYPNGYLYDHSSANLLVGGYADDLWTYNTSTVNISGGDMGTLEAHGTSVANVSGGYVYEVHPHDTSTVNMSGGMLQSLYADGTSTFKMSNGYVSTLSFYNSSRVDMSGGTVSGTLNPHDTSMVNMSGGSVQMLSAWDSSTVKIYGYDFQLGNGLS